MIEPRVYRAAFVPAALVFLLAMFLLERRPPALPQGLPADVLFDGDQAAAEAARITRERPDRGPGSRGDAAVAGLVASTFARRGFPVERDAFEYHGRELVNVVARRAGGSRRLLAVVAARDAGAAPDAGGSAADTAALLELARVLAGRPTRRTLVLASLDGSTLGEVGTERFVRSLGDPDEVDAVLVLSNLGATRRRGSLLVPWSGDARRVGIGLERTAADSIRLESEEPVGGTGTTGQLIRMALPLGIGAQGVLLERGFESVRISGSGELPAGDPRRVDSDRLGDLGRAALRTVTALDRGGRPAHGPRTYVTAVSQVLPGWVLTLLGGALLLPALLAAVDAFARARRRHEPVARWGRWIAAWLAAPLGALVVFELLALVGATPDPPPAAPAPGDLPLGAAGTAVMVASLAGGALAWWLARRLAMRPESELADPSAKGAGCALALALVATVLAVWLVNPFAALLLIPSAHLWTLAVLLDSPRRRLRGLLVALGALPPLLALTYYLIVLRLDPVSGAWYLLLLVTGGAVALPAARLGCIWLALLAAAPAAAAAAPAAAPPPGDDGP
ncbi:MAG: hypothetical protein ACM3UV_02110, partial [Nocardioidaceae bacterium]